MDDLSKFWDIVVEVWRHGLMGVDIGRLIVGIAILGLALVFRRLFSKYIVQKLVAWADRTETVIDNRVVHAVEDPVRFLPVVLGVFFAVEFLEPAGTLAVITGNLVRSLVAFTIFWALYNVVEPLSFLLESLKSLFSESMVEWLVKAIKGVVMFVGGATVLETWGIEVAPIIAGFGLFGVAVALGAQDMFKNLIAGVTIIAEKRFQKGDWIRVDGVVEGTVEIIGFRSTRIRRFDKAPVHVPNAKLSDNAVTNFSAMTNRRIYWKIGVVYRTSVDQLRCIVEDIRNYIFQSPDFETDPQRVSTLVYVDGFNDSSIDIMVYCFTKTTKWGEWLAIKERLLFKIKEIVTAAGSDFAFPSTSLYVENPPPALPPAPADGGGTGENTGRALEMADRE